MLLFMSLSKLCDLVIDREAWHPVVHRVAKSRTRLKRFSSSSSSIDNRTVNFQIFKLVLEKAEEPEIKLPTSAGSWKSKSSRKTSISALLTMPKPLCGSQETVENSERDGNTRPPNLPLEKSVCRSGSNS